MMPRPLNPAAGRYDLKARPEEIRLWAAAAERRGMALASWIRMTLTDAAREQTPDPKKARRRGK